MSRFNVTRVTVDVGDSTISFETGKLAKQAGGAVVVSCGDTMVLNTATIGGLRDVDFLPLTVDVEERMYAAGKIPGSFFRREGKSSEKATLTARMIDRPIRPLFPGGWHFETQLVAMPMSVDGEHPYDILAMNGASAALTISSIPLPEPIGAVRIGKIDGTIVVNPPEASLLGDGESDLDLIVAGTADAILMVEAGANIIPEAEILDALDIAHDAIKKLVKVQLELRDLVGKEKIAHELPSLDEKLLAKIKRAHGKKIEKATQVVDKLDREDATDAAKQAAIDAYVDEDTDADEKKAVKAVVDALEKAAIRDRIAVQKVRPDGREATEIRQITIETGTAP
ncbi:MAG: polyribonucleotide nucleotidyltransferase, partial [Solirubrobacterales bacterium]|nr:polyribonucleotide nucleotidyltransferase [Solirubrobacterales bacterium]